MPCSDGSVVPRVETYLADIALSLIYFDLSVAMPAVIRSGNVGLLTCFPTDYEFMIASPAWAIFRGIALIAILLYWFSLDPIGETGLGVLMEYCSLPFLVMIPARLSWGLPRILLRDGVSRWFGSLGLDCALPRADLSWSVGTWFGD